VSPVIQKTMISSEIFHQKLQTGQIHEALALILNDASELDVTTRMTEVATSQSGNSEYLRTKINLLTGEIHNEVGKETIADSTSYIKLQQLHIDQIVVSYRLVQGYLDRVKAILTVLDSSLSSSGGNGTHNSRSSGGVGSASASAEAEPVNNRLNCADLVARLRQATAMPSPSVFPAAASASDRTDIIQPDDRHATTAIPASEIFNPIAQWNGTNANPTPIAPGAIDDDLDLSIDPDGTIWEEWVEDEDFLSGSLLPPPSSVTPVTSPERPEHWGRRQLHPIEVKPTISRTTTESAKSTFQWDRFEPEFLDGTTKLSAPNGIASDPRKLDN
jgi:hypothetical protein